jgi:aspartate-semialdehyde dehydrogenase
MKHLHRGENMKNIKLGIIGATGCVGLEMLKVLEEKQLPISEIRLFASIRSKGKLLKYNNQSIEVSMLDDGCFDGLDFVLGAATNEIAKEYKDKIINAKAVFIDNSSAFRMDKDTPLVVPEINPEDAFKNNGVIANPNCSTIITMVAISAINKLSKIQAINACTYQAVSGAGVGGMRELQEQTVAIMKNKEFTAKVFSEQIAYNCIPQIGNFNDNGYTTEEMKMQNEGRKIMHLPNLLVDCTCVRVPVMRSHSISVTLQLEDKIEIEVIKESLSNTKGVLLKDDISNNIYPTPLKSSDQDLVFVGRVRKDLCNQKGVSLWCVGDQIRKGAATNAIQIMELFLD